jgi:hypothetical protein
VDRDPPTQGQLEEDGAGESGVDVRRIRKESAPFVIEQEPEQVLGDQVYGAGYQRRCRPTD